MGKPQATVAKAPGTGSNKTIRRAPALQKQNLKMTTMSYGAVKFARKIASCASIRNFQELNRALLSSTSPEDAPRPNRKN